MKKIFTCAIAAAAFSLFSTGAAHAQYYQIANQMGQMLQPALSGAFNYKGFVEAEYLQGIGTNKANFLNFTTSQGLQYANWFYMGVGAGVSVVFADNNGYDHGNYNVSTTQTGVIIPLFTDFRFNIGNSNANSSSFFIDVKIGGAFLVSNSYIEVGNGYISNKEYFYLRPALGVRIPVSSNSPKQAVDIGVSYQLLTTNNYWYWGGNGGNNVTLNGLGVNLAYEW